MGRIDPGLRPSDARTNLRAVVPMSVGDAQRPRNVVPRHQLEILRGRSVVAVLRDEQAAGIVWSEIAQPQVDAVRFLRSANLPFDHTEAARIAAVDWKRVV